MVHSDRTNRSYLNPLSNSRVSKKFESIRINSRDLAWSQGFPRDPGLLQTSGWIPGTSPGTTPGIPSKSDHVIRAVC